MPKKLSNNQGFTIIELLVATTVFSIVLLVFLVAFLRIGQLFYKGVTISNTQDVARTILQDISDDIQFSNGGVTNANGANGPYFCIGNHRYSYNLGQKVTTGVYGLARETMSLCKPLTGAQGMPVGPGYIELLGPDMQVNKITIKPLSSGAINVSLHIVFYGNDNTVFVSPSGFTPAWQAPDATCSGPPTSTQYCATADYSSTILQSF